MLQNLKTRIRDLLPVRYQVPAKYWFCLLRGTLEPEMKLLGLIARNNERVIDIGGNRGIYTYHLWKLRAVVEVFEPNPTCNRVLTAWATGRPNVNLHAVALSNQEGSATLHIPVDESGVEHDASASIENTGFALARHQVVPLRTLDSFSFKDIWLIKIDVEGHEYGVIEGAAETLACSAPALLVEIEQRHNGRPIDEVFQKILGFGYQGFFLYNEHLYGLAEFDAALHQPMESFAESESRYVNNFLFLHQSKLAGGQYNALLEGYPLA